MATSKKAPARRAGVPPALWISLGLIAINLIVYAQVRSYGFVSFDDGLYVTDNPNIAAGLTSQSFRWAWTNDRAGYWVPLTWLSHILDIQFYGLNAGPQHVMNVVLHVVNTLLLFGLLRRITGARWQSAFVAALFAVHPLHVESVAWIAERKDVLSTLFWILTLWFYTEYVRRPGVQRYIGVIVAFALALMAKPMVVTLPVLMLLLDIWPFRRVTLERGQSGVWIRLAAEKIPLFVLAIASSVLTIAFSFRKGTVLSTFDAIPLSLRAANGVVSISVYLLNLISPANLAPFYPLVALPAWQVVASIVLVAGASLFVIWKIRTQPYLFVGWFWYLFSLAPVLGLVQAGTQSRADRFTYTAIIGVFVMAAWGIPELLKRWPHRSTALAVACALLISASAFAARAQVGHWENRVTLWEHALKVTDSNYVAHNVLGMALADGGRVDEAMAHYREALRDRPDYTQARNNLGIALARQGRLDEAISEFHSVLSSGHPETETYYNLGFALAQQGRMNEAIAQYSEALRLDPTFVAAYTKLGDALFVQGKLDEAILRYREALRIRPNFAEAHNNLGVALTNQNKFAEAIAEFAEALRINPGFAEAHNGLGAALANEGRYGEAVTHFSDALRLQPRLAGARENLERALQLQASQQR